MFFRSTLLIAGAGLAVAQSISSNCTSALLDIATSPDATCLDLTLLAPLALSNSSSTSVIPTTNSWLTGACSQGPCSNDTLAAVATNFTNGCSSDLESFGLSITNSTNVVTAVQVAYPAVREIACLQDTSANSLCVTELLNDLQSTTTTLSIANIVNLLTEFMSGSNVTIPQNVTCSNCSKAAYTIVSDGYPTLLTSDQSAIQSECGSSFTDGQMPSNIQETASNSSSTTSTSAAVSLSVSSLNVGAALLVAVSSAFAVFA